jgi:hypothetical protein
MVPLSASRYAAVTLPQVQVKQQWVHRQHSSKAPLARAHHILHSVSPCASRIPLPFSRNPAMRQTICSVVAHTTHPSATAQLTRGATVDHFFTCRRPTCLHKLSATCGPDRGYVPGGSSKRNECAWWKLQNTQTHATMQLAAAELYMSACAAHRTPALMTTSAHDCLSCTQHQPLWLACRSSTPTSMPCTCASPVHWGVRVLLAAVFLCVHSARCNDGAVS